MGEANLRAEFARRTGREPSWAVLGFRSRPWRAIGRLVDASPRVHPAGRGARRRAAEAKRKGADR